METAVVLFFRVALLFFQFLPIVKPSFHHLPPWFDRKPFLSEVGLKEIEKMDLTKLSNSKFIDLFWRYKKSLYDYYAPMWLNIGAEHEIEEAAYEFLRSKKIRDIEKWANIIFSVTERNYLAH